MGFVFWYLGNGAEYALHPRSVGIYHREYFVGFRQEEITFTTDRLIGTLKAGYLTGIQRTDENGNVVGDYDAVFTGANLIFMNAPLRAEGWSFGVGPGVLTSRIYNYIDYALTLNAAVIGNLKGGDVLILLQNIGYGRVLPTPELYIRGLSRNNNFQFGPFLRLFGDRDIDGGFIFSGNFSLLSMRVSPSLKNALVGMSVEVGPFTFAYDYSYYWIGYSTHRIGFNISWGKQQTLEEKIKEHERKLTEHEKKIASQEKEIRRLKGKIEKLEMQARTYARNLVKQAEEEDDPNIALQKLEIAYAFDTTLDVQRKIIALKERVVEKRKLSGIRKVDVLLKNGLYSEALASTLLLLEEFPDDPEVLKLYRKVKRIVEARKNAEKIKKKAEKKYTESKMERAKKLVEEGRYVEAARILNTLPTDAEKIRLMNRLRSAAQRYVEMARSYIKREDWTRAKYYLEKSLKIYPLTEATALLSYVEGKMKKSAHLHYIKALELYQKGDIVGAFAHIKEAHLLDPKNERYRNVYFRLKTALKED